MMNNKIKKRTIGTARPFHTTTNEENITKCYYQSSWCTCVFCCVGVTT